MKKYITIATLLAAGSAFASAATELTYWGGANNADLLTVSGGYTPYLTANGSNRAPKSVVTALTTEGNADYSLVFTPESDGKVYNPVFTLNNDIYLYSLSVGSSSQPTSFTINFGTTGSITTDQNINFGQKAESITIGVTLAEDALSGYSAGSTYERVLLTGESNWGIWNYSDRNPALTNISALVGYENVGVVVDSKEIGAGQYGLVYTNSEVQNGKDTVRLVVGIIPEPSAFGMLAGLGALALVASRRRRK